MQNNLKKICLTGVALLLAACGSYSQVSADGKTDNPVFPKVDSNYFNHHQGTFPNIANLRQIAPGMTKDQLYDLIGRPQYNEGFRVVEWDYLFHFRTPGVGENGVTTCQFKVLFDHNKLAQSFYWKAVSPEGATCPPEAAPEAALSHVTIAADALFAFDSSELSANGRAQLDNFAKRLQALARYERVAITGYTDRLGSAAYNQNLSQARANTVRQYLIARGIPAAKLAADGRGEANPVTQCSNSNHPALVACLAPNRRVEIQVSGAQ